MGAGRELPADSQHRDRPEGMHDNGTFFPSPAAGSARRDRQVSIPCDSDGNLLRPYVWAATFAPLGLTIEPVVDVSAVAVMERHTAVPCASAAIAAKRLMPLHAVLQLANGTAHRAIPAMVRCAVSANITGLMLDFESFGAVRPAGFKVSRRLVCKCA